MIRNSVYQTVVFIYIHLIQHIMVKKIQQIRLYKEKRKETTKLN